MREVTICYALRVHTHAHTHAQTHSHIYTNSYTHTHAHIHAHKHADKDTHTHTRKGEAMRDVSELEQQGVEDRVHCSQQYLKLLNFESTGTSGHEGAVAADNAVAADVAVAAPNTVLLTTYQARTG